MREISVTWTGDLDNDIEMPGNTNISHKKRDICRLLKMAIFILCCTGFGLQTKAFLTTFYSHPTVINFATKNSNDFPVPALTICSKYFFRYDIYCKKLKDDCKKRTTDCESYDFKCIQNKTKVTTKSFPHMELVPSSKREALPFGAIHFKGPFRYTKPVFNTEEVCYRSGNGLTSTGLRRIPVDDYTRTFWKLFQITFLKSKHINFHELEYATLYVHSPFLAFKYDSESVTVKKLHKYNIHIRLDEELRLPSPYDTDCVNYTELWWKNNMSGPLSREMCQHDCMHESKEYFENGDMAYQDYIDCKRDLQNGGDFDNRCKCMFDCKDECSKMKYEVDFFEEPFDPIDINPNKPWTDISLFIKSSRVRELIYQPKYMDVEFFSYIGGFIGCWLGISLWSSTGILWKGYFSLVTNLKEYRNTMTGRGKASKQKNPSTRTGTKTRGPSFSLNTYQYDF